MTGDKDGPASWNVTIKFIVKATSLEEAHRVALEQAKRLRTEDMVIHPVAPESGEWKA